jgi:hypothetical protein
MVSLPHPWSFYRQLPFTATSSANIYTYSSTLVILFSKIFFLKENNESDKLFGNKSFVDMKFSKLILFNKHVLTGQGPMVVAFVSSFLVGCNL